MRFSALVLLMIWRVLVGTVASVLVARKVSDGEPGAVALDISAGEGCFASMQYKSFRTGGCFILDVGVALLDETV